VRVGVVALATYDRDATVDFDGQAEVTGVVQVHTIPRILLFHRRGM
jgi:hypothetical protein